MLNSVANKVNVIPLYRVNIAAGTIHRLDSGAQQ